MSSHVQIGVYGILSAVVIVLISIGLDQFVLNIDSMLSPCQHGTQFVNNRCSCAGSPFTGQFCGMCNCLNGYCSSSGTSPRITSDYSCRCPSESKFFGFFCDQCHAVNKTKRPFTNATIGCEGECDEGFYGTRCERTCFADVRYVDTLGIDGGEDEMVCKGLRKNGGACSACSGHGSCHDGFCECFDNWFDDGPSKCSLTCDTNAEGKVCSGHGVCTLFGGTPSCNCENGWNGENCDIPCPGIEAVGLVCSGHGACSMNEAYDEASCLCEGTFIGEACETECPGDNEACSGHGECTVTNGVASCTCDVSILEWTGEGCECNDILTCNNNGVCANGVCQCTGNYEGAHCLSCKENYFGSNCQFF